MNTEKDIIEQIDKLPRISRFIARGLYRALRDIIDGECDERTMLDVAAAMENNAAGRYSDDDLMNYDEAGRALGLGTTNRVKLKQILDANNIKQVKINNMCCGFEKAKIMELSKRIKEDNMREWYKRRI